MTAALRPILALALLAGSARSFATSGARPITTRPRPLHRAVGPVLQDRPIEEQPPAPPEPTPAPTAPPAYETQNKFLGIFDVTEPGGALAASLIVSGGFGLAVEFIKFLDPNTAGDSIFGSFATM